MGMKSWTRSAAERDAIALGATHEQEFCVGTLRSYSLFSVAYVKMIENVWWEVGHYSVYMETFTPFERITHYPSTYPNGMEKAGSHRYSEVKPLGSIV